MIRLQFLEKIHILKVLNPQRNTQLWPCSGETRSRNSCAGMLALYLYLLCLSTMWCLLCGCSFWSLTCRSDAEPACIVFPAWRTGTGGSTGDRHTNAPYLHWNHTPVFFFSDSSAHRNFTASYSNETTLCLNSGGQRLWRTNRNLVCVWFSIVDEWNRRKTLLLFSGGEVCGKGERFWNCSWCYISAEPVNHAAHVGGLLYSCHCTQQQMHCTHWLVSNAVRLTCGLQLKAVL